MSRWRSGAAAALTVVAALVVGACGGPTDGDEAVRRWAGDVLGLDDRRAACVAGRLADRALTERATSRLVRSELGELELAERGLVADTVVVCSMATDDELLGGW